MDVVTALAKLQLSFTAAVTSAKAAANTDALDVRLHVEAVARDTDIAEACCMRRVQGEGGTGVPKALEEATLSSRRIQHALADFLAVLRKTAACFGLLKRSDW
jgi:aminoglycoside phosphotransferase (APT) family kinase protein